MLEKYVIPCGEEFRIHSDIIPIYNHVCRRRRQREQIMLDNIAAKRRKTWYRVFFCVATRSEPEWLEPYGVPHTNSSGERGLVGLELFSKESPM